MLERSSLLLCLNPQEQLTTLTRCVSSSVNSGCDVGVAMISVQGNQKNKVTYRLEALHGFVGILGSDGISREWLSEVDEC